jgi:hypothetical protein
MVTYGILCFGGAKMMAFQPEYAGCRLRAGIGLPVLLCALLLPACAKRERGFVTEIVDGVRVVRNLAGKPGRGPRKLRATEDLALGEGSSTVQALFYAPQAIDAVPDGDMYVLDGRDALIRQFNQSGSLVRSIGRKGQGPGEFEAPAAMTIRPDGTVIVVDSSQMRLTLLTPEGEFMRSTVLKIFVSDISAEADGTLVAAYSGGADPEECVGILDDRSGELTALFSQKTFWPSRLMNKDLRYDFPYFVRFAAAQANRLVVGSGVAYKLSLIDMKGRPEMTFEKDADKKPVEGQMLTQIAGIKLRGGPNPFVHDPYFPFFDWLSVDERGRIWIQHYLPKLTNLTNPETPYDVFSADGIFLFEARLPGHILSKLVFKNGFVYTLKKRESGDVIPVRLLIEEPPD